MPTRFHMALLAWASAVIPCQPALAADMNSVAISRACSQLNAALQARDYDALGQIWSAGLTMSVGSRTVQTSQSNLGQLKRIVSERPDLALVYDCKRTDVSGDGILAFTRGRWTETWSDGGDRVKLSGLFAAVWSHESKAWKMITLTMAPLVCRGGNYCPR